MNQIKIGNFIKQKRKEKNITQNELSEKLNLTNRAISKWENGICMPDSGIIPELCDILDITINDLFSGEVVDVKDSKKQLEKNLLEMIKQKEENDRKLLRMEILMGILCILPIFILTVIVSIIPLEEWVEGVIIGTSLIPLLIATPFALRIEQTAGYYECKKCHHRYIPTYKSVFVAMHVNRTRYMKCPKCKKYSWNKKILGGNEND